MNSNDLRLLVNVDLARFDEFGVQNAGFRTITLTDTTDYTALGIPLNQLTGIFIVKDPLGNIIHQGSFTSPDIDLDQGNVFTGVQVPLDAYGRPINGTYSFDMIIRRVTNSTTQDFNTGTLTANVCVESCGTAVKPKISLKFDCNQGIATGCDLTRYKSGSTITRRLTMTPPSGAKYLDGTDAQPFVTSQAKVQSNSLWTEVWQLLLRSVVVETTVSGALTFQLEYYIEAMESANAVCNIDLCGLYKCIDKRLKELELLASRKGGVANSLVLSDHFLQIITGLQKLQLAQKCGKVTQVAQAYELLKIIVGCDCGCGEDGVPTFVYPTVNTPGQNVVVEGSQYIAVAANTVGLTTTYTVSLSTVLTNLINLIKTYQVISTDATIDVSASTVGTSVTFDLSVNTSVIDDLLGALVDASCMNISDSPTLSQIIQALVDQYCAGGLPPVAEDDILICQYETPNSVLVTANDFFTSNVVVSITTPPVNGNAVVLGDNKTIQYTPDNGFDGNDTLIYTITDAIGQTATANVNIIVNPVVGTSCNIISAAFVAGISVQAGAIQAVLTNITNYLGNVPTSNDYVIEVRDSSNNVLQTYNVVGNNNSLPQVYVIPDTPLSTWVNIRIVQTVVSEDSLGQTCGSDITSNVYAVPNITSSIFAGVTVTCLGVTNGDPDTVIMQALVDKACSSLDEVETENGISGDGNTGTPVKLGGTLTENTTLSGDYNFNRAVYQEVLTRFDSAYQPNIPLYVVEDTMVQDSIPASSESNESSIVRKNIFFDNVTYDMDVRDIFLINKGSYFYFGGDSSVLSNALDNADGQNIYTLINGFYGCGILADNDSIDTESLVNIYSDGVFANAQLGTVNIDTYYHVFLRDSQNAGSPGDFIQPNFTYGIYQEGADDDSFFAGEVTFDQAIVVPSDERSKDVLREFDKGLDALKSVDVVVYKRKAEFGESENERVGVVAQQIEPHIPEAVKTGRHPKVRIDDFKSVSNDTLLFTAINAIKELSAEVERLKNELAELKK